MAILFVRKEGFIMAAVFGQFFNTMNNIIGDMLTGLLLVLMVFFVLIAVLSVVNIIKLKLVFKRAQREISFSKLLSCYCNLMVAYNAAYLGLVFTNLGADKKKRRKTFHKLLLVFWFQFNKIGNVIYDYLFVTDIKNENYIIRFAKDISQAMFLHRDIMSKRVIIDDNAND